MKIGRYIIGLLSGLTFGMLFAPKKGEDLRKDIAKKASQSNADGLKVLGNAFMEAGNDALTEIKNLSENEQIAAALDMSKEKLKEYFDMIETRGYDAASLAQEKFEEIAEFAKAKAMKLKDKMANMEAPVKNAGLVTKRAIKKTSAVMKKVTKPVKAKARKTTSKRK